MVFKDWRYSLLGLIVGLIYFSIVFLYSNISLTIGNLGMTYFVIQTIAQFLIGVLFMIFVPMSIYKIILFSDFSAKENTSGIFGGFVAIVVAGCPACSVTLASYIGLSGFFSVFPFYGLELKLLTIPLMGWANYSLIKNLTACEMKRPVASVVAADVLDEED
jgi:hypothetical protein